MEYAWLVVGISCVFQTHHGMVNTPMVLNKEASYFQANMIQAATVIPNSVLSMESYLRVLHVIIVEVLHH